MSTSAPTAPNEPDPDAYAPIKTAAQRRVQDEKDRLLDQQNAQRKTDELRAARAAKEKANNEVRWLLRVLVGWCMFAIMYNVYLLTCLPAYLLTCLPAYLLTYFCPQAMEDDRRNGRHPVVKAGEKLIIGNYGISGHVFVVEVQNRDGKDFVYLVPCDKFGKNCLSEMTKRGVAKSTEQSSRRHLPTFRREEVVVHLHEADVLYVV